MEKSEEVYLKLAQKYDDDYNHEKVKEYCQKALEINPNSYKAYIILGDSYLDIDEKISLQHYEKALELNPKVSEVYVSLGMFYHYEKDELNRAKAYYEKALRVDAKDVSALYELANVYYLSEAYQEAIQGYKDILEIDKGQTYVYYDLAKTYVRIEAYHLAIEIYKNLIDENPKDTNVYFKLAEIYETLNQYDRSIHTYKKVLHEHPDFPLAYCLMAKNYETMPNPDYYKALKYYQKALALNSKDQKAHWGLNRVYIELDNYPQAIKHSKQIVKLYPQCSAAHHSLGVDYLNHSEPNLAKAKKCFVKAMKLDKKYDNAYLGLFECQLVEDRVLDSNVEEQFQTLLNSQSKDEDLCESKIQYQLLKILNDINFGQSYDLEAWQREYRECDEWDWTWTAIDRWVEDKEESDIKDKLLETVALFKRCQ